MGVILYPLLHFTLTLCEACKRKHSWVQDWRQAYKSLLMQLKKCLVFFLMNFMTYAHCVAARSIASTCLIWFVHFSYGCQSERRHKKDAPCVSPLVARRHTRKYSDKHLHSCFCPTTPLYSSHSSFISPFPLLSLPFSHHHSAHTLKELQPTICQHVCPVSE